jgi:hypothetical protein
MAPDRTTAAAAIETFAEKYGAKWDCREFRVWGRTMPLKEPSYVAPQTAYDPG